MPRITADTQNALTPTTDITLNPFTKSIGAVYFIWIGGINVNVTPMNIAYPTNANTRLLSTQ